MWYTLIKKKEGELIMTWKDVALKLADEINGNIGLCEIFDEMNYLLGNEEVCCKCKECLIRHMEKEKEKDK